MSYMKHDFITWIQSKCRNNGKPYSKETINNYVGAIETYAEKLDSSQFEGIDLFSCDSLEKFAEIKERIIAHEHFDQFNISRHRIFSSALKIYQEFLDEFGAILSTDQQSSFEEWLRNYPDHKYIESTIKRYIRALQKAEEWLGITLPKPIMFSTSFDEFMEIQKLVKEAPNYNEINQNHGNGDLSAALKAYEKFIVDSGERKNTWFPSLSDYNPGITATQWLVFFKNSGLFNDNYKQMMSAMFAEGGQASCTQLSQKYGNTSAHYNMTAIHMAEQASDYFKCPLWVDDEGKNRFWTVLFVGKEASGEKTGSFIWKMREELFDALSQYGIEQYYKPVIKTGIFDSWEIVSETQAVKTCDKSFFDHNGSGVPKGMLWFFDGSIEGAEKNRYLSFNFEGKEYQARFEKDTRNTYRIFWNTDLGNVFMSKRKDGVQYVAFTKTPNGYSLYFKEGESEVSTKQLIDGIIKYIESAGFLYENGLVENFFLSLKSKPFVILAGTSGTGKTRLVRLFAEAISAEYQLVAVRPDWSDSSDLFGHVDLNGNFISGAVLDFMNRAKANPEKPYILCLDEMNLARVEYYLSDILSVMETREVKDGVITSDPILNELYYGKKDTAAREKYGVQRIPENFYIVGTVNMDETTFPFSRKVLDRANTIEFSYVDLDNPEFGDPVKPNPENLPNSFLKTEYLFLKQCIAEEEYVKAICADLQRINSILQKAEAHVGYRVRDEIVFYMLNNKKAGLLSEKEAFDNEIMQKILPRIQGSSASVKKLLCALFVECAGSYSDSNDSDSKNMEKYLEEKRGTLPYPKSAEKIMFMTRRFEEDGFTSYWL